MRFEEHSVTKLNQCSFFCAADDFFFGFQVQYCICIKCLMAELFEMVYRVCPSSSIDTSGQSAASL